MAEDRPLVHNAYVGLTVVVIAVTPAWLLVLYQVSTPAERSDFWGWDLWPAFIPLAVGLLMFVALIRGWRLPGLARAEPRPNTSASDLDLPPDHRKRTVIDEGTHWHRVTEIAKTVSHFAHAEPATATGQAFDGSVLAFSCREEAEPVSGGVVVDGRVYGDRVALWLHVLNSGDKATFYAHVNNVSGMPFPDYDRVPQPAWLGTSESRVEIESDGARRIHLGEVTRSPRAFWFHTVEGGKPEAGRPFVLADHGVTGDAEIMFDLAIFQVGNEANPLTRKGRIIVRADGELPTFKLTP